MGRKYVGRVSLMRCHMCRHVARNHFQLRAHLIRYHKTVSKFRRSKRKSLKRKNVAPKSSKSVKSEPQDVGSQKNPKETTSVVVINELTPSGRPSRRSGVVAKAKLKLWLDDSKPKNKMSKKTTEKKDKLRKGPKNERSASKKRKKGERVLQPWPCHLCDYVGRDSFNLKRHMQSKHEPKPPKAEKMYYCDQCNYKNRQRFLVKRHSAVHSRGGPKKGSGFSCDKCDYVSASVCNLRRHQYCRHEKVKEAKLGCSLCEHREPDRPALFAHFGSAHGVIIESDLLEFEDFSAFLEFKADMEKATFARFVRQQTRAGQKKHVIFKCHRDGIFKSKSRGEQRKRALKTTGSNKINSACPASMRTTMDPDGKVSVVFTKTHVGHSNEVCRLTLTKDEKILIAEKLECKRSFQDILVEIRNNIESERLERIHLLSRKDLQNIERWYKTRDVEEPPRVSMDIDIDRWVGQILPTKVVQLYKKPATILPRPFKCLDYDDFVLILANDLQLAMLRQYGNQCICIDNAYDNALLKLTVLMVLDDSRQGFPCAFMLSSKMDKTVMKVFVDVVKKSSGCSMTPAVLMTDVPDYRRTEWSAVMDLDASAEVLYSPWSVEEDLKRNLLKVKSEDERQQVYEAVRKIIYEEIPDNLPCAMDQILHSLNQNASTELFGKYFKSKFSDTSTKWAVCLRNLPTDACNGLESTNGILRFVYAEGQKNDKLEDCLSVLMTCSRDELQDRIVLQERTCGHEESADFGHLVGAIAERHKNADKMKTQPADSGVYEIMEHNLQCRCGLRCYNCDICVHSYRCTCSDSILGWTICQHIHFCVISNPPEQETILSGNPFDPLEEKRKLLLEFENMCDDIAADADSSDEPAAAAEVMGGLTEGQLERDHRPEQEPVEPEQKLFPPAQQQQPATSPELLDDVRTKLQKRFQIICQEISSDVEVTLIEQALASLENSIGSSQAPETAGSDQP